MKNFIKINLIILVIFCLLSNVCLVTSYAEEDSEETSNNEETNYDDDSGEENIENTDEEKTLDDLQLEKSELENNIDSSNEEITFIQSELSTTQAEIAELNQEICDKELEMDTLEAQEEQLYIYIEQAEKELEKSNAKYEKQKDLLEKRLVAMYEMGDSSYLDVLLNSKNIIEFFSNFYLLSEISTSDEELLEEVADEQTYNKALRDTLETKKAIVTAYKETREKTAIALANMVVIKNNKISELSESELELQSQIEEYQNQVTEIEKEIRVLAIKNISDTYVGGEMAWPVPGYTTITSPFGMRTHPITGIYKLHSGVDIGAPEGANFIAANDGVVTYAGWNAAYGNMVIIDHGGGITTLYAHGSQILVNVGDTVYQGTAVLKVGHTGYATGPHAHFEVRINGVYVEPLNYITSYRNTTKTNSEATNTANVDNNTNENIINNDTTNSVNNTIIKVEINSKEE